MAKRTLKQRGYVYEVSGVPLTKPLLCLQLGQARKLFRYRASVRGVKPDQEDIDIAIWIALETGMLVVPYGPT